MPLTERTVDGPARIERQMLTGMIVNDAFLRDVRPLWRPELLASPTVRLVGGWCIDFFTKYAKAPGLHVRDMLEARRGRMGEEEFAWAEEYLAGLDAEWKRRDKFNTAYILDAAEQHVRARAYELLAAKLEAAIDSGKNDDAERALLEFRHPARPASEGFDPLTDQDAIVRAYSETVQPLFHFGGTMGRLVNAHLIRGGFIGLMGPEKRGKTFMLTEFAIQAIKARCNVVFLAAGDMNEPQMVRRITGRLVGRPMRPGEWFVPVVDCGHAQAGSCPRGETVSGCAGANDGQRTPQEMLKMFPGHMPCVKCRHATNSDWEAAVWWERKTVEEEGDWRDAWKSAERMARHKRGRGFKLLCRPAASVSVSDLRSILQVWEDAEGFVPDVIVVDYADILAPENKSVREFRHQQNDTWTALRALAQERHCLIVTATQADAASYTKASLGMENFSEDKRKLGHVTGMLALNQTAAERERGLMRLRWVVLREGGAGENQQATLLQWLAACRPVMDSV